MLSINIMFAWTLTFARALPAPPAAPCTDLTPIDQIKAFVTCQASPALRACGGLGDVVAGFGASLAMNRRYRDLMSASHDTLTHELAEAARDEDRASRRLLDPRARLKQLDAEVASGPRFAKARAAIDAADAVTIAESDTLARLYPGNKVGPITNAPAYREREALKAALKRHPNGPVFEPLIRQVLGDELMTYDIANLAFEDLPPAYRRDYEVRARAAAEVIRQRLAQNLPLDEAFVERAARDVHATWIREARKRPHQVGLEVGDDLLMKPEVMASRRIVRSAIDQLRSTEVGALARGFGAAIGLTRRLGRASPFVAGGLAGATLFALGQAAETKATACDGDDAPFVNRDPAHNCAARCEVDGTVAAFLMRSEGDQRAILRDHPGVCAYYRRLHQCFFARPRFTGLACQSTEGGGSRVTLQTRDEQNRARTYRIDVRADQTIGAIGVYNAGGMKTRLFNFANVDEELTTRLGSGSGAAREFSKLKLFIPGAVACCADQTAPCAGEFGGAPPRPAATPAVTATAQ